GGEPEEERHGQQNPLHSGKSVARAFTILAGSSETIASTPALASRSASRGSFAVHARTGAPRRCAAATTAAEQSVWWSESAFARAVRSRSGTRTGSTRASEAAPARVSGPGHRSCETP